MADTKRKDDEDSKRRSSRADVTEPPLGTGEPEPPLNGMTAAQALPLLQDGDTSMLEGMTGPEIAACRAPYKEWANKEQDRLRTEYDRVYSAIVAQMTAKGEHY